MKHIQWKLVIIIGIMAIILVGMIGPVSAQEPDDPVWPEDFPLASESAPDITTAAVAVEQKISVQGRMTDNSGAPYNGSQYVTYRLYEVETGGDALCTFSQTEYFTDGLFNGTVDLTNSCQDTDGVFPPTRALNSKQLYLGITVTPDSEMTPRRPIYPVPYAYSLVPGANLTGSDDDYMFRVINNSADAFSYSIFGYAQRGIGVRGRSDYAGGVGVWGYNNSDGPAVVAQSRDGDVFLGYGKGGGSKVFKVENDGNVYADGGYHCGNDLGLDSDESLTMDKIDSCLLDDVQADFAEMMPASRGLEPGDLLAINLDGELTLTTTPYQASVVGVHSTRPSYLGNSRYKDQAGYAPLAMVGVVPVKASAENGPIQPGDLLVASATPGHAMKAETNPPSGTVVGKALSNLEEGTGTIQIIVMLQ